MKYLKTFNESYLKDVDTEDEVLNTIKDILLELEDLKFTVNTKVFSDSYDIVINKPILPVLVTQIPDERFPKFGISEIRDTVERIYDYLPNKVADVYVMGSDFKWRTIDDFKTYDNVYIRGIEINIDK